VPIAAVVSDGQRSIRNAVATALPEAVHGLCHFHYFHEAAKPFMKQTVKKRTEETSAGIRRLSAPSTTQTRKLLLWLQAIVSSA